MKYIVFGKAYARVKSHIHQHEPEEGKMKIAWVLGKKLSRKGEMSKEFRDQMLIGIELLQGGVVDLLIISGAQTRSKFPSEAEVAFNLVPENLRERVVLEDKSKSTVWNIKNTRVMTENISCEIESLRIITGTAHMWRTKFLLKIHWNEVFDKTTFVSVPSGLIDSIVSPILNCLTKLDPNSRHIILIVEKFLRNG